MTTENKGRDDAEQFMYDRGAIHLDDSEDMMLPSRGGYFIAGATADSVKDYARQIAKTPVLTEEEEYELGEQLAEGRRAEATLASGVSISREAELKLRRAVRLGNHAKNELVSANLKLVLSVAKSQTGKGLPLLDIIQEGNYGLMYAANRYDHTRGFRFASYAIWWIRQGIDRAITNQSRDVRLPVHVEENIRKVAKAKVKLTKSLKREPTVVELAAETELSIDAIERLENYGQDTVSLFTPLDEKGEVQLLDVLEDAEQETLEHIGENLMMIEQLNEALETLSEREADVIRGRFGLDDGKQKTLDEIGAEYGLTRERIRQIEVKAMSKLKHPSQANLLRDFLED
jgi:RNA polymerase primary sigma factor